MILLLLQAAFASYGTPVDGYPTPAERELHLWTNAVRISPPDFDGSYRGCSLASFQPGERTSKSPFAMHIGLFNAARGHTQDMVTNDFFSHTGSNGSSAGDRIFPVYNGNAVGENIAGGQATTFDAVMGWMCSPGHRSNIMENAFSDLGTGVIDRLYTQAFGGGANGPRPVLVVGAHSPFNPSSTVELLVVANDTAPLTVDAIVDGAPVALSLLAGTDQRGLWGVDLTADGACHRYAFVATRADGTTARFPESGDYGYGTCDWDDATAQWMLSPGEAPLPGTPDDDLFGEPCGCATGSAPTAGWLLLGGLVLVRRRR